MANKETFEDSETPEHSENALTEVLANSDGADFDTAVIHADNNSPMEPIKSPPINLAASESNRLTDYFQGLLAAQ